MMFGMVKAQHKEAATIPPSFRQFAIAGIADIVSNHLGIEHLLTVNDGRRVSHLTSFEF